MAGRKKGQGMNWIAGERRHGIYHRDSSRCVYCQTTGGASTLGYGVDADHIWAQSKSEYNDSNNVVMSCKRCNNEKSDRSLEDFVNNTMRKRGFNPAEIFARIRELRHTEVDRDEGERRVQLQKDNTNPPPYTEMQARSNLIQDAQHDEHDLAFARGSKKLHPPVPGEGDAIEREIIEERNTAWTKKAHRAGFNTWQEWYADQEKQTAEKEGFSSVQAYRRHKQAQAEKARQKKASASKVREERLREMLKTGKPISPMTAEIRADIAAVPRRKSKATVPAKPTKAAQPRRVAVSPAARAVARAQQARKTGKKGGKFVITKSGKKRYVKK